jgi:hypothetical protein
MQQMMSACKKEFDTFSQAFKLGVTGAYYRSPTKLPKKRLAPHFPNGKSIP